MYMRFFGLKQEPFSLAPDPRYLYMSKRHREALAHLLYGVGGGGGFVLLSGEIGAGKTTVCRCFLEQIPKRCNVAYIFNPKLTALELVTSICDEFHIPVQPARGQQATVKLYVDALNGFLLKTHAVGQNNVLIIDEAQMLSVDVLEQLRLLTNLETNERKLLQIVLIGQPELRTMLERPDLEQLAQRVIARFHLKALSSKETEHYIRHRLSVAGMTRGIPFDRKALQRIHEIARGVPRRINLLCDRVMLGAYAHGKHVADIAMIEKAAREVFGKSESSDPDRSGVGRGAGLGLMVATGLALSALLAFAIYGGWRKFSDPAVVAVVGSASASASASASRVEPRAAGAVSAAASAGVPLVAASAASAAAVAARTALVGAASSASSPASAATPAAVAPTMAAASASAATDFRNVLKTFGRDERSSWRELAPMWGAAAGADGDPCSAAARQHLRCSKFAATLPMLRSLGRPGFVNLRDDGGKTVSVVLVGLGSTTATLLAGGRRTTVPLAPLAKAWHGEFGTLWRLPDGYATAIAAGASGPLVDRLATQLAALAGEPAPADPQSMDAALRAKVSRFQSKHGLTPVGKAGPTTFMQINRATGVDEPRLSADGPSP
jgi:general secretion pathway protein A